MLSLEQDQIETLTGAANDKLRTYFKLFGFAETDAPTMTPAMVMAAIEAGKGLVTAPAPAAPSTLRTAPAPRTQLVDPEALKALITAELHRLARNGFGPTMGEWDRQRSPSLPTAGTVVSRMGMGWLDLIRSVGLEPQPISTVGAVRIAQASRQMVEVAGVETKRVVATETEPKYLDPEPDPEPEPAPVAELPTPPTAHNEPNGHGATAEVTELLTKPPRTLAEVDAEAAQHKIDMDAEARRAQYREILVELQSMAVGNVMPTMQYWEQNKPAHLPTAQGVLLRYGLDGWGELADRARLIYLGRGKRPPVLKRKGA